MKKLLLLLPLLALPAKADITLAWDPLTNFPSATYTLYAATNSFTNAAGALVTANVGTNTQVTLSGLTNFWHFRAAAAVNGLSSDLSAPLILQIPPPPANFRTVIIQGGPTITNFQDLGFFRIRIQ